MLLVTASENSTRQTESVAVMYEEMWCCRTVFQSILDEVEVSWKGSAIEGDSPVGVSLAGLWQVS